MTKKIKEKEENIYHLDLQGSISWKTADTGESIPVCGSAREALTVYLLCPNGTKIKEDCYRGDCVFGGKNVWELLAKWNWPEQCNDDEAANISLGKDNAWSAGKDIKFPIKLVRNPDLNYDDVEASEICEQNGWDYEIGHHPKNSEILNKYSEDKVMSYFGEIGTALVEVHYPWSDKIRSEGIHFILSGYADGSGGGLMYMPSETYAQSCPKKFYDEDDMLIWVPEDDIMGFMHMMIENQNGFVIGNGGFIY